MLEVFRLLKVPRVTKVRVLLLSLIVIGFGFAFSSQSLALKNLLSKSVRAVLGGTADIKVVPGTSSFPANSVQTVNIQVNTHNIPVDGIQVMATLQGDLPSDLVFTAPTISGLNLLIDDLTIVSPTEATVQLVYLTPIGSSESYVNNAFTNVGQFTFTAPDQEESFTFTFNTTLTKVIATETKENVANYPDGTIATYTVNGPTPTPTITPSPSSTPTNPPSSTPTPTPTPSPTATPTPLPTNSPTPSPTPTATPVPTVTPTPTSEPTNQPPTQPTPTPTGEPTPGTSDPKIQFFRTKFQQLMEKLKQQTN